MGSNPTPSARYIDHVNLQYVRAWSSLSSRKLGFLAEWLEHRWANRRKTFNPLTETPLSRLHHQDRRHDPAQALIHGETVAKAAERGKVAYTTAFRWRRFPGITTNNLPNTLSWRPEIEVLSTATVPEAWTVGAAGLGPNACRLRQHNRA